MKKYLILALVLTACSQAVQPTSPDHELGLDLVTPSAIQANTTLLSKASAYATPQTVRIKRQSLGKPLLYIAAVMQTSSPDSKYEPFQPRLVAFTQEGDTIVLSDVRPRQRFTESETLPRIIAQFPIVKEDADAIEFDFANGMKNIFTLEYSTYNGPQSSVYAETPQHSYITRFSATANTLTLDHHLTEVYKNKTSTIVIRHIFKRDTPSSFQPRESDTSRTFGFFVTPPWYEDHSNTPHRYITRWDIQRPIAIALNPEIPKLIRPAIQDAIAAWNTVFGKEVLVLSPLPANKGPLDLRNDISINWITNDSSTWSYGLLLAHPVTGQILHGDVILTSARFNDNFSEAHHITKTLKPKTTIPNGFESANVCTYSKTDADQLDLAAFTSADLQTTIFRMLYRELITHELGHVLGLRHNFAGSTEGNLTRKKVKELLAQLAKGQHLVDTPLPSSSIMDYVMYGLLMTRPGDYDLEAIQWAYLSPSGHPPHGSYRYCADEDTNDLDMNSDTGRIADCQRYDFGPDPLVDVMDSLDSTISDYVSQLVALTGKTAAELANTPLAELPSTAAIAEKLYQLHNYVTGQMVVWSVDHHTSIERIAAASNFLKKIESFSVADDLVITSTRDNLAALINHGDKAEQLRAIDANVRLTLGIQKLEKLLDAPVGSLNKSAHGTTTHSDNGS